MKILIQKADIKLNHNQDFKPHLMLQNGNDFLIIDKNFFVLSFIGIPEDVEIKNVHDITYIDL